MRKSPWAGLSATFLLLLIISIPAVAAIANPSWFPVHDDQSIARLYLLDRALHQGIFYPRWVDILGFGFGYPLFNFYPPLVYYVGEIFHLLGGSFISSIKLTIVAGFVLAALSMYLLAREFVGKKIAFLASILYTYFTYHAVLAYVRGALAEFLAYTVLPFIFWSIVRLYKETNLRNSLIFAAFFALLILTHPLIALPSLFFIAAFITHYMLLPSGKNKKTFLIASAGGVLTALALSSFFWLPSLIEKKYTLTDSILTSELASYKIHFVYLQQFLYSPWGYGGSVKGLSDGLSFALGKAHIGLAVLAAVASIAYLLKHKKLTTDLRHFYFFVLLTIASLFMATDYSSFVWDLIPPLWFLQFPWRFLTFAAVFIALVGAYAVFFLSGLLKGRFKQTVVTVFIVALSLGTIMLYGKYFRPSRYLNVTDIDKTSYQEIAWRVSRSSFEFIPRGVVTTKTADYNTTIPAITEKDVAHKPYEVVSGRASVTTTKNTANNKVFEVSAATHSVLRLNTFYFPGWRAYINGAIAPIDDNNGYKLITIKVPAGESTIILDFKETSVRLIADITSLITFFAVVLYLLGGSYFWPIKRIKT